jgi:hypothetical protein
VNLAFTTWILLLDFLSILRRDLGPVVDESPPEVVNVNNAVALLIHLLKNA